MGFEKRGIDAAQRVFRTRLSLTERCNVPASCLSRVPGRSEMSLSLPSSSTSQALSRRSPSPGGRADPATGLEIALSQFGAILTDDERKRLQAQKSGLNDADAAFKFTLELDELDPVRRGRVVATKLCSLLQTVQSFGQVIETYVSSNPQVAALIWGTVKLTFMVLINFTTYFQRFTDLLSGFDHLIPQFTAYEKLFPNSDQLKKCICNFHLAIVTCCTEIVNLTRLPWHEKAWAALTASFEAKIRPSVDNIRAAANQAKDEIELIKTQHDQLSQVEHRKNEKNLLKRAWKSNKNIERVKKDGEARLKLHKWQSLLKKLPLSNYESAYRNARSKRHKGTAQWVFDTQQFQDWYRNDSSAVLNVAGKIGSGKTVLTANIIDYIMRKKTDRQAISFFFVRFDDVHSQSSETIVRSLVHQTVARASIDDSILELMQESDALMFDDESLLDLILHQVALLDDCFFVIDGFDECTSTTQYSVLNFLSSLGQRCLKGRIKTVISARDSITELLIGSLSSVSRVVVGSDETNRDLALFARAILWEKQERGDWSVGDPTLIDEILHLISLGGEGMFLWVYLTIEDISTRRSDADIRQALLNIPRNLPDTFDRVLQRIEANGNTEIVCSVFKWTAAARQPLALEQLSEVLNIKINQSSSQQSGHVNGINHLPAWCENLIQVEDGSETVHFSHHSIRSYLLGPTKKAVSDFNLNLEDCDDFIGDICLTYLHFSDLQTALTRKFHDKPIDLGHVPLGVVDHTIDNLGAKSHGRRIARFAKMPFGTSQSMALSKPLPVISDINIATDSAAAQYFPFLPYAKDNWYRHTVRISPASEAWELWRKINANASFTPWTDPEWHAPGIPMSNWLESSRDIVLTSQRTLEGTDELQTCFSLHKAIAFADLLDHQPLLAQIVSKLIDYDLPVSPWVLHRLVEPRAVQPLPKEDPTHTWDAEAHQIVIDCVTRYTAWGGQRWPCNFSDTSYCEEFCNDTGCTIIHRQSGQILSGKYNNTQISQNMQVLAHVAVANFTERNFDLLVFNDLQKLPAHGLPTLFQIAIERGSPWSFRAIDVLAQKRIPEERLYSSVAKVLTKAQDIDALEYLFEIMHLKASGGPNDVQLATLGSALERFPQLPKRLLQRVTQLCVPPTCGDKLGLMQLLLRRAIQTTKGWGVAAALHSCILASVPAGESAFGLIECELAHIEDMLNLVDGILRCVTDITGQCALSVAMEQRPQLHYCEEHKLNVLAILDRRMDGDPPTWNHTWKYLKECISEEA